VPATRYRLTVDLARADAALLAGVSVPAGPYRSLRALPAEVWLDGAGLARRISVNSEPAAATDAQVWSIVELWDFGVAADITPPGPGEVLAPAEAYRLAEEGPPGRDPDPACAPSVASARFTRRDARHAQINRFGSATYLLGSRPGMHQIDSSLFSVSRGAWNFLLPHGMGKVAASSPLFSFCGADLLGASRRSRPRPARGRVRHAGASPGVHGGAVERRIVPAWHRKFAK
jgi:hypothetical protein